MAPPARCWTRSGISTGFLALAADRGVTITHVFETHVHDDYLTGGLTLARETGADYHVSAAERVAFDREAAAEGTGWTSARPPRSGCWPPPGTLSATCPTC